MAAFRPPRDVVPRLLDEDFEFGGIALNDASQGLDVQVWRCFIVNDQDIYVEAPLVAPTLVLSVPGITEISFCFDQAMHIFIAYVANDVAKFYWFDSTVSGFVTTTIPGGVSPRCVLDDHRPLQSTNADIILGYISNGALCFRAQRDRYGIEYVLYSPVGDVRLVQMSMNRKNRMQFQIGSNEDF